MKNFGYENFDAIVLENRERIYATAYQMLGCHADADCITQETFLNAYKGLANFRGESSISTWLIRIACNLSLNLLKSSRRRKTITLDETIHYDGYMPSFLQRSGGGGLSKLEVGELHQKVHEAIEELPSDQKAAVVLVLLKDMKHLEVAKILGCAESTISWRIYEARKTLVTKLKKIIE